MRVLEGHQPLVTLSQAEPVAEVVLERPLLAPGVRRIRIHHGRVRGALYLPPGDGPFPGVVDMFGSIGGLMEYRSGMPQRSYWRALPKVQLAVKVLSPHQIRDIRILEKV